ncbi:MAG TPA: hypothetical protein VI382_05630 [Candidatus Manganitrophaceae bacterium]|nr:hypothetical protein [Candidatus Manganitrophaceae bacterium]
MYEEPYRWVEAIRNRREYLEEQLASGAPIVSLPFQNGLLLATIGGGTAKLYEIYDQIVFGGIGHPADLEKLRTVVLDLSHVEGFNRSPTDVTVRRLIKFGLAPLVKQAFEEALHAPYICKIVMAEVSAPSGKPLFVRLNYDGVFEESEATAVLAPTPQIGRRMEAFLNAAGETGALSLSDAVQLALRTWAVSKLPSDTENEPPAPGQLDLLLKKSLQEGTVEIVLLDRTLPGSSKYRALSKGEIQAFIKVWLK